MARATRSRIKSSANSLPQNLADADALVLRIADLTRSIQLIESARNEQIDRIAKQASEEAEPLNAEIKRLFKDVAAFASVRRAEITEDGKSKSVKLPSGGTLRWRFTPPSVTISGPDAVLARLKQLGLNRFIRTKEELDKEAMLREPETAIEVEGITIGRKEEFTLVLPGGSEITTARKAPLEQAAANTDSQASEQKN